MADLADIATAYAGIAVLALLCVAFGAVLLWRAFNKLDKMNLSDPWQ